MKDSQPAGLGQSESSSSSLHSEKLCSSLCAGWFPFDPNRLQLIRSRLQEESYTNSSMLVDDLRGDFSLFAYCTRELASIVQSYSPANDQPADPVKILKKAELSQLKALLAVPPAAISRHDLSHCQDFQAMSLMRATMGATVAEVLSNSFDLDADTAFACALFRQLGMALVAWNYPHVCARALNGQGPDSSVDTTLCRLLGVTPALLGITIARQWRLSPVILGGMGDQFALEDPAVRASCFRLQKVCEIGEAMARASDPERRKEAAGEWSDARAEIERALGDQGFRMILEKIDSACGAYQQFCPQLFTPTRRAYVDLSSREKKGEDLFSQNEHIAKCPEYLRDQLKDVYASLDGISIRDNAIQSLLRQCIASVGFTRGCVYVVEPDGYRLSPRFVFGEIGHCRHKVRVYSIMAEPDNPIIRAYNDGRVLLEGDAVINISGVLGRSGHFGVLYLEMPKERVESRKSLVLDCYCAVLQALGDCFGI